jgi:hypothetical protein
MLSDLITMSVDGEVVAEWLAMLSSGTDLTHTHFNPTYGGDHTFAPTGHTTVMNIHDFTVRELP